MLIVSLIVLTVLFILNLTVGMYYGFGQRHYWFFELLHFLGGFFVAMFLAGLNFSIPHIFIGLASVTFLWELAEYLIDKISGASKYIKMKFRLKTTKITRRDTVLDIVLNFAGALLFVLWL